MSVIVTVNYEGETFEVEIFHDGGIEFPGRDFKYEQAAAEFAPPGPVTVRLCELWKKSPIKVVCENLELPESSLPRLAADWAEHVMHFFEDKYPDDRHPRAVVEAVRDFIAGKIDRPALERVRCAGAATTERAVAVTLVRGGGVGGAAAAALKTAQWAAWATEAEAEWARLAAVAAAAEVAYNVSSNLNSSEWHQARDAEIAWQIRRFVDCMEAVGLGKDWPDMKVTT